MAFPAILEKHVHDYHKNKSMQQIYEYNVFPVVQDQIRYNGQANHPYSWGKTTWSSKNTTSLEAKSFH